MSDHETPCEYVKGLEHRIESVSDKRDADRREIFCEMKTIRERPPVWIFWAWGVAAALIGWAVPLAIASLAR